MAELKTKRNLKSVTKFLDAIPDEGQRRDCRTLSTWMQQATGAEPVMWGTSIVGFGDYHYRSASGREGDWFLMGFSPRKQSLTLYLMGGVGQHRDLLDKLGKHKTGVGCLYLKSLDDVHHPTLKQLMKRTIADLRKAAGRGGRERSTAAR